MRVSHAIPPVSRSIIQHFQLTSESPCCHRSLMSCCSRCKTAAASAASCTAYTQTHETRVKYFPFTNNHSSPPHPTSRSLTNSTYTSSVSAVGPAAAIAVPLLPFAAAMFLQKLLRWAQAQADDNLYSLISRGGLLPQLAACHSCTHNNKQSAVRCVKAAAASTLCQADNTLCCSS